MRTPWLPADPDMLERLADPIARIVQVKNLIDSEAVVQRAREDVAAELTADLRELRQRGATEDLAFLERVMAAMDLAFTSDPDAPQR